MNANDIYGRLALGKVYDVINKKSRTEGRKQTLVITFADEKSGDVEKIEVEADKNTVMYLKQAYLNEDLLDKSVFVTSRQIKDKNGDIKFKYLVFA
jgi:hypothetical protein